MLNYFSKEKKKELARDILALGSIAFYFIVIGRALIGPYWAFVYQLLFSAIALLIFSFFIKECDFHLARGLILVVLTIIFYNGARFTIFAVILLFLMIIASLYAGKAKSEALKGLVIGAICAALGYFLAELL